MPRYKVPYVVMESPSLEHSMPDDDMTPIPHTYYEFVDALNASKAKVMVKELHPCKKVGKPELIE